MNQTVTLRPKWDHTMQEELVQVVGKILHDWDSEIDLEDCVDAARRVMKYRWRDDGYEIAKELERHCYFTPDSVLVSALDEVSYEVTNILKKHIRQWVKVENIKPTHAIGEIVTGTYGNQKGQGEIVEIYEEDAAYGVCFECFGHVKGKSHGIVYYENISPLSVTQ